MTNHVYIAMSLDGYIADKNNNLDWLTSFPNSENLDLGYFGFIQKIDALLMGRNTFEFVMEFNEWPYTKPVFVLSNSLNEVPNHLDNKVTLVKGNLKDVIKSIKAKGYNSLYVDGGVTIQKMLREGLIDVITVTIIPILLGGGYPLFGDLDKHISLKLLNSNSFYNGMVQIQYKVLFEN